ncbi:MAG TPA: H-type lectin domain-containing protein [Ignavibacteriaceae bacterium]
MRKLSMFAVVLFFVAFSALVSAQTQSGQWSTKAGDSGYNLDTNTGERAMTIEVNFKNPYDVKPKVMVSVTQIDTDKGFNSRYNVEVLSVSRDGFTLKIRTWADSKVYSLSGYWLAYTE